MRLRNPAQTRVSVLTGGHEYDSISQHRFARLGNLGALFVGRPSEMQNDRHIRKRLKKHKRRIRKLEAQMAEGTAHRHRLGDGLGALEAQVVEIKARVK